jgi:hypothetical protein
VTAEPRGGGLRLGRHARTVEREDRVMGDDGPDSAYQSAVCGEPAQAAAGVLELGDALDPARFRVWAQGRVRVHQPPHRGDGSVQGGPLGRGDGGPQGGPPGPYVSGFEGVQSRRADHGGQQHHAALAGAGGAGLGERGRAVGAEHVVRDLHALGAAEGVRLRLVDPAHPAGDHSVGDELVQQVGDGLFGTQAHAGVLAQEVEAAFAQRGRQGLGGVRVRVGKGHGGVPPGRVRGDGQVLFVEGHEEGTPCETAGWVR